MPKKTPDVILENVTEQRAPDGEAQLLALAEAEALGALPETDRRDDVVSLPVSLTADDYLEQGYAIRKDATGYQVTTPDGEHAHGRTLTDAVKNVGAVVLPNFETQTPELHRRDGSIVPVGLL